MVSLPEIYCSIIQIGVELRLSKKAIIVLFLTICSLSNLTADGKDLQSLKKKIEDCYYTFDTGRLESVLKEVTASNAKNSHDWHYDYYEAILRIQLGKIYYLPNSKLAYSHFDKSIDCLLRAKEKSKNPEIATLLSCAYGKKSSLAPIKAIYFGIKAKDYIYEAHSGKFENAKLYLTAAIHMMHTPESFGGDKKKARNYLNKCLQLNRTYRESDPYVISWAENAEVYAYMAQLDILLGNKESAGKYMKKSLELQPDYGFVKIDLQNQLNKMK